MKLNEKIIEAQDHLDALDEMKFDHLEFDWEGMQFHAAADTDDSGNSHVHIKATLGRLYFTIEDTNQRAMALERLFATNRTIDGKYEIGKKGDISFKSITRTDEHLKGTSFMSALTMILLESENHMRALRAHLKPI